MATLTVGHVRPARGRRRPTSLRDMIEAARAESVATRVWATQVRVRGLVRSPAPSERHRVQVPVPAPLGLDFARARRPTHRAQPTPRRWPQKARIPVAPSPAPTGVDTFAAAWLGAALAMGWTQPPIPADPYLDAWATAHRRDGAWLKGRALDELYEFGELIDCHYVEDDPRSPYKSPYKGHPLPPPELERRSTGGRRGFKRPVLTREASKRLRDAKGRARPTIQVRQTEARPHHARCLLANRART